MHVGIIAGDIAAQQAFEAAVRPYALGIATRPGLSIDDAEEIWNDAFRVGLERAPTIVPLGRPLRAYVLSVAHAAAVDRVRARARRNASGLEGAETDIDELSISSGAMTTSLTDAVIGAITTCLESASPLHREVMTMTANGLTAREIARITDITEANAAKIRQRAREWFKNCLGGVGL